MSRGFTSPAARHTPAGSWARIGRLGGYYNLKYYKGFDHLVANTEDIAEWVVGQGWPAGKVSHIPNFAQAPEEAAPLRDVCGSGSGSPFWRCRDPADLQARPNDPPHVILLSLQEQKATAASCQVDR